MNPTGPAFAVQQTFESWIPILQLAAREVFELMLNTKVQASQTADNDDGMDNTAMLGLAGQLCGVMKVRCRARAAALMASRMLGIDPERAGPEMFDALGEVCNMIGGNFKNKISGLGDGCMLSVPTVITGADYNLHSLTVNHTLETALLFEGEPVIISLEIHS